MKPAGHSRLQRRHRFARPLLGTFVEIEVIATDFDDCRRVSNAGFEVISRIHRLMSFYEPNSDVARLNREAHRRAVAVSAETRSVLDLALQLGTASSGLFDVTIAPRLMQWGYLPRGSPGSSCEGSFRDIVWDERSNGFRFNRPLAIDLGGIAKGYAVDQAIQSMLEFSPFGIVVNAGGDLRVWGTIAQPVALRHPLEPTRLVLLGEIMQGSIATSGTYFTCKRHCGRLVSPFVDPRSGEPIRDLLSVSVMAETCALADALTKVLIIGQSAALPILEFFDAHPVILRTDSLLISDGARWLSPTACA